MMELLLVCGMLCAASIVGLFLGITGMYVFIMYQMSKSIG